MKKRFIALALVSPVILLVGAIALLPSSESSNAANPAVSEKPVKLVKSAVPKPVGPWLITLVKATSQGPKAKNWIDEDKTHEATGQWVTAHIQVKNTSKTRQSLKDVFFWPLATILDDKGGNKEADGDVTDPGKIIEFEDKPFAPGEVRIIKLTFDIPEQASVQRIELGSAKSDAKLKVLPAQ